MNIQEKIQNLILKSDKFLKIYSALECKALVNPKENMKNVLDIYFATCHLKQEIKTCIYNIWINEMSQRAGDDFDIIIMSLSTGNETVNKIPNIYYNIKSLEKRICKLLDLMKQDKIVVKMTEIEIEPLESNKQENASKGQDLSEGIHKGIQKESY